MSHRDEISGGVTSGADHAANVVERFDVIRAEYGDRIAVLDATGEERYADLGERSARLATVLRNWGLQPGDRCAIMVPRSRDTLALILAILRVGAVYVPLDPAYPRAQLDFIVSDCAPRFLISQGAELAHADSLHGVLIDLDDLVTSAQAAVVAASHASGRDDPAYIMYTSGSTGKPKGVIVPHRAILRLVHNQTFTELSPQTCFLNLAPLAFDASTLEIWGPLLNGGCAAIINDVQPSLDTIAAEIARLGATSAWFTAGLFNALADYRLEAFGPLKEVLTGGDVLSPVHVRKVIEAHAGLQVINGYGPTENTTFSCCYRIARNSEALAHGDAIPVGHAIAGTQAYILDDKFAPVADGEVGELVVGGDGVALGYLNRPELTAQKFVDDVFTPGAKLYRTGDLVRRRPDGAIAFLGRNDRQIKIAGKRIELDEIEHALRVAPGVADAAVAAFEGHSGKAIAGFVKADAASASTLLDALRAHLKAALPDYMMPAQLRVLPDFPLTPNGKIDRKALLALLDVPAASALNTVNTIATQTQDDDLAGKLAAVFEGLLGKTVERRANFFDLGLRSLDLMRAHAIIVRDVSAGIALVDLFRHPNVDALVTHLRATLSTQQCGAIERRRTTAGGAIAVIGMAGRFPGARNVAELWANLLAGRDCITHFDVSELEDSFDDDARREERYVKARPILSDVDRFDAGFFGMLAREAALTDPQQRLFLEIAWEAFEDAGYDPAAVAGAVGVFAGTSMNTYFLKHVLSDRSVIDEFTSQFQIGEYQKLVGAGDFVATRTAYKLGLKGPAISVQTACSTSLTAIGLAVENLRAGRCDMALAGGVSITFPQKRGYFYEEGGMGAPDGVCRPFDANAKGTVFGSGAGVVLLKRLEDAIADHDPISAVIRGVGMNNDGSDKVGFTAPSVDAQARAIAIAHAEADIDPATIGYVEAHGTATPLGDPIEFAGLVQAFRLGGVEGGQFCALGSAKANVGHLDAAAGVTGLIAASLALRDRTLPPLLHFQSPNPGIDAASSPFYFNATARAWDDGPTPRRAGVSSFGVGGTNVHVVLEEAPKRARVQANAQPALQLLPLSARSAGALERAKANLASHLAARPSISLGDVAATLQTGRRAFPHRAVIVADSLDQALAKLQKGAIEAQAPQATPPVVFMFPGQGAQYPGMGAALYRTEPVYREWIDKGALALEPQLGLDIRTLLLSDAPEGDDTPHPIRSTIYAQPALFLTEYALAQVWMARGIKPTAMIGHSIGELVAACVAEAIGFEDALRLIAQRGALMQAAEPGAMLVVRLPEAELRATLPEDVDLAAINAPSLCVVAGPFAAVEAFEATLKARDIEHRRLHTSHAFHSRMMSGVVEELAKVAGNLTFALPKIPYVSSVTGQWAASDRPVSGRYWASHCRDVVRFGDALATVTAQGKPLLLEIGPGRTLATFATQGLPKDRYQAAIASLPDFALRERELAVFAEATGRLWLNGITPDWTRLQSEDAQRIALPTYPFEPERHWIDAPATAASRPITTQAAAIAAPASLNAITDLPQTAMAQTAQIDRKPRLVAELASLLTEMSGEAPDTSNPDVTFWDLGYDSLFMGQVSRQLRRRYDVTISFRQIMSDYPTLPALAQFLDGALPPDPEPAAAPAPAPVEAAAAAAPAGATAATPVVTAVTASTAMTAMPAMPAMPATGDVQSVIRDQIAAMQSLMTRQLEVLQGVPLAVAQPVAPIAAIAAPAAAAAPAPVAVPVAAAAAAHAAGPEIKFEENRPTRFTAYKPGATNSAQMTDAQSAFIADLTTRYSAKTATSKSRTQSYRAVLADPRTASGFREEWKELVYPIVAQRSKGSKIWDVDGNEYIDLVNGYGQTAFGHTPDFVVDAVNAQMAEGFAIGPQSPLAGEVAQMFAEMTGHERVTFCNTGSEAVMAAMRLARTVTGKERVVCFDGDYHGQFDEVLVKPGSEAGVPRAFPLAPGIPNSSVGNMVVLPYARTESLEWIKANIDDIAAVLIEPVQSRHPNLRPKEFVQQLREVTAANESALIVDEVVTGFRVHPAGMQGYWGIKGDMATYGKVVGGGLPVGVLAGSAQYMDALDGGQWQFGDASVPEVPPTFFAGTFVRHPVVLAAMKAVLLHLKAAGPALQETLGARMEGLVQRINTHLEKVGIATRAESFSSWFYISFAGEDRLGSLFYAYMRYLGVHIMEGFPCFLTTSHSDEDIRKIGDAFVASIAALQGAGILGNATQPVAAEAVPPLTQAPLTEPQKEIWMSAQQSHAASLAFNESFTLELNGALNEAAFERAFAATVARHDALRAHFSRVGDTMFADPAARVPLEQIDLSGHADAHDQLAALIDAEAREVFDLTRAPLARAALVRLEAGKWAFVFTAHHIICDGWSINIILRDLQALYAAEVSGNAAELDEVQSFLAFAKAQDEAGVDKETRDFWMNLHREGAPQLDLPGDRARPEVKSFNGASTTRLLSADLLKQLKTAASKQGCSLFAALFGGAQVLFGSLAGRDDVVIAAPMAGQSQAGEALLVGHCVNFLPLRVKFDRAQPFAAHMKAVRDHLYDAGDRQNYTYGALVRDLGIKRDFSRLPLTDLQFNLEKVDSQLDMAGVSTRFAPNAKAYCNFDLFLNVIESAQGLRLDCDFNTDVYDEATIQRWLGHYETLLTAIARDADTPVAALPLLSDTEIRHLRDELNASQRAYELSQTAAALIAVQAHQTPDAIAVRDELASFTYRELDARANQIARRLVAAGIAPRERIAIAMERTAMTVAAMIGVWRAGCAYVPLDMTMPAARLHQILDGADIAAVLSDAQSRTVLEPLEHRVLELEALLAQHDDASVTLPQVHDADAAYVIFTSGSTGQPKGVEIPHRALSNFLLSMAQAPGFTAQDRIVAVTTFSFDISGLELFLPLVAGGQVFVAGHAEVRTGYELVARLKAQASTMLQATPSLWRMLLEAGFKAPQGFKILCGGEPLPRDLADDLLATGAEVWNLYGPTETTIWSAAARVQTGGPVVIGAPLANTQLHVLTDELRLAPQGVTGELWIGGEGLATGYFKRPDLTDAAFQTIAVEGAAPVRLYRTGDLAKRLADGSLQHLGRRDQQIKLRGFRIEIGDIEAALRKAPGVAAAAVALHSVAGHPRLVGYVVEASGGKTDLGEVAAHVATELPAYMVPTLWMTLGALPQTQNGKLDRKALPVPTADMVAAPARTAHPALKAVPQVAAPVEAQSAQSTQADEAIAKAPVAASEPAALTPTQATLVSIWADVLGLQQVGIDQPFFSLGADSLQLFRIVARVNESGLGVDARQLMKNVSIAQLAQSLDGAHVEELADAAAAARPSILNFKRRNAGGM
ncbi:amino acid adenylation domain-containing protein [Paraburkholderia bannensis]|uniref:Amino acid adenylation domain-containing protein n=1 Tax=Paraburkholderia bannensis TaxID=765414 RepID=A0A7W9WT54_9BURK|nr:MULTISPECIES: non-ribosomal peptide synthetase/type I polyketide synthase [Paraburkholderia]MBB3257989.1 amino acid adenylation domain-containing protein [Paraburkholderia sp. WP4_3_2]MBB6103002.1 amino acid adenylation domain-containing protein [Paraburkholderia bannensis]